MQTELMATIREATPEDLPGIEKIEIRCFSKARRSSRRSLVRSLKSPFQRVWVGVEPGAEGMPVIAVLVLYPYPQTVRIYSLAVWPPARGRGLGARLVREAVAFAKRSGRRAVSLEADVRDRALIRWYERQGFHKTAVLPGYYGRGYPAVRMRRSITLGVTGGRGCGRS